MLSEKARRRRRWSSLSSLLVAGLASRFSRSQQRALLRGGPSGRSRADTLVICCHNFRILSLGRRAPRCALRVPSLGRFCRQGSSVQPRMGHAGACAKKRRMRRHLRLPAVPISWVKPLVRSCRTVSSAMPCLEFQPTTKHQTTTQHSILLSVIPLSGKPCNRNRPDIGNKLVMGRWAQERGQTYSAGKNTGSRGWLGASFCRSLWALRADILRLFGKGRLELSLPALELGLSLFSKFEKGIDVSGDGIRCSSGTFLHGEYMVTCTRICSQSS